MWDLAFLGGAVLFFSPFVSVLLFFRWVAWGLGFFFFFGGGVLGFFCCCLFHLWVLHLVLCFFFLFGLILPENKGILILEFIEL